MERQYHFGDFPHSLLHVIRQSRTVFWHNKTFITVSSRHCQRILNKRDQFDYLYQPKADDEQGAFAHDTFFDAAVASGVEETTFNFVSVAWLSYELSERKRMLKVQAPATSPATNPRQIAKV